MTLPKINVNGYGEAGSESLHGHDGQDAQDAPNAAHLPGPDPTVILPTPER